MIAPNYEVFMDDEEDEKEEEVKEEPVEEVNKDEEVEEKPASKGEDTEKQWYVTNTYSGRERVVADYLNTRKKTLGLENEIFRVVVPEREIPVIDKATNKPALKKDGTPRVKIENLYPGYIFVEAIMTDQAWYVIRNTQGVTGIVGSSGSGTKPYPIPREDMIPILKAMNLIVPEVRSDYQVGEKVKILKGAFVDEIGEITSINTQTNEASINVIFFGRPTSINVSFSDLEKAD